LKYRQARGKRRTAAFQGSLPGRTQGKLLGKGKGGGRGTPPKKAGNHCRGRLERRSLGGPKKKKEKGKNFFGGKLHIELAFEKRECDVPKRPVGGKEGSINGVPPSPG